MKKIFLISFCIFGFSFEMLMSDTGLVSDAEGNFHSTTILESKIDNLNKNKKSNNPLESDESTLVIKSKSGKDDQSKSDKKKNSKKKTA